MQSCLRPSDPRSTSRWDPPVGPASVLVAIPRYVPPHSVDFPPPFLLATCLLILRHDVSYHTRYATYRVLREPRGREIDRCIRTRSPVLGGPADRRARHC